MILHRTESLIISQNFLMATSRKCPKLRLNFPTCEELINYVKSQSDIHFVDWCFADALGRWHHCTATADHLDIDDLKNGWPFDASSIPVFEKIDNCDYVVRPDSSSCFLDPFTTFPTLHVVGSLFRPDGRVYEKCPRETLKRACEYMRKTGIADELYVGPEAEFFLLSSVQFSTTPNHMMFAVDGEEAYWNSHSGLAGSGGPQASPLSANSANPATGGSANLGHRANLKQGYMTSRPMDSLSDVRSEMVLTLEQVGIRTEKHHHEVAACQMEINVAAVTALEAADNLQVLKYVVKNVAQRHGKTATFMPKPLSNDNGSGLHCNQSLWKNGKNLFYDESNTEFHQMSDIAMFYAAGILNHAWALMAFACPTTNSYRRLVPEFEAPIHLTYAAGNRSTAIRIPVGGTSKTKRIEFRSPDGSGCPYLLFAAILLAGLDGIQKRMQLPPMGRGNLFDSENPSARDIRKSPTSLEEALDALEADNEFLTKDGVFDENFLKLYIAHKRNEGSEVRRTPHPMEFQMYYSC